MRRVSRKRCVDAQARGKSSREVSSQPPLIGVSGKPSFRATPKYLHLWIGASKNRDIIKRFLKPEDDIDLASVN